MRLRYIIGSLTDFESVNTQLEADGYSAINFSESRRSVDGTQVLIHQELLDDYQVSAIITAYASGAPFEIISNDNPTFQPLMESPEWT